MKRINISMEMKVNLLKKISTFYDHILNITRNEISMTGIDGYTYIYKNIDNALIDWIEQLEHNNSENEGEYPIWDNNTMSLLKSLEFYKKHNEIIDYLENNNIDYNFEYDMYTNYSCIYIEGSDAFKISIDEEEFKRFDDESGVTYTFNTQEEMIEHLKENFHAPKNNDIVTVKYDIDFEVHDTSNYTLCTKYPLSFETKDAYYLTTELCFEYIDTSFRLHGAFNILGENDNYIHVDSIENFFGTSIEDIEMIANELLTVNAPHSYIKVNDVYYKINDLEDLYNTLDELDCNTLSTNVVDVEKNFENDDIELLNALFYHSDKTLEDLYEELEDSMKKCYDDIDLYKEIITLRGSTYGYKNISVILYDEDIFIRKEKCLEETVIDYLYENDIITTCEIKDYIDWESYSDDSFDMYENYTTSQGYYTVLFI